MDTVKRNRLIEQLASQPEPQLVAIDVFFDGNDDEASMGCNLAKHPGIDVFRSTFARVARRSDVQAVYAQISELDPGEGCWPFTDTVFIVGTIPERELAEELAALEPDEVAQGESFGIPSTLANTSSSPVLVAWWD